MERKQTKFERVCSCIIALLISFNLSGITDSTILSFVFALIWSFVYWVAWKHYFFVYGRKPWLAYVNFKCKVGGFWLYRLRYFPGHQPPVIDNSNYRECCELIEELCNDKLIPLEEKETLYQNLCRMWTEFGMGEGIYQIPIFIQEKWKKAQAEDKLRQLKKDF